MRDFNQLCCEKCWHTTEKPCEHFIQCCTEGPLCHHDDKCEHEISSLRKRLKYEEHDLPIIIIGMGTCGLCLLYTSPSPRDRTRSRMPSSA